MSRFYGTAIGRGKHSAHKAGTPETGIETHAAGWNVGVAVKAMPNGENPAMDTFHIYLTGGSNLTRHSEHIGTVVPYKGATYTFVPAGKKIPQWKEPK